MHASIAVVLTCCWCNCLLYVPEVAKWVDGCGGAAAGLAPVPVVARGLPGRAGSRRLNRQHHEAT